MKDKNFICSLCKRKFVSPSAVLIHINKVHKNETAGWLKK